jgi:hypothetical protein
MVQQLVGAVEGMQSAPVGGIDSTYRPARRRITFDLRPTGLQLVRFEGTLTASIASRTEHLPLCAPSSSLVVLAVKVAAAAITGVASDAQAMPPATSAASGHLRDLTAVDRDGSSR